MCYVYLQGEMFVCSFYTSVLGKPKYAKFSQHVEQVGLWTIPSNIVWTLETDRVHESTYISFSFCEIFM